MSAPLKRLLNSCDPGMNSVEHRPQVLVFDSGVGSLSIGAEIHHLLPDIDLLYAMDRGGFPYGMWQEDALVEHILQRIHTLLQRHRIDIVVVACNSASTAVLPSLRQQVSLPVVGVVPAIKPAALQSKSRVIGLLATPGTIKRRYTAELIDTFASDCTVLSVGAEALAPAVETLFWQDEDSPDVWQSVATAFHQYPSAKALDTIVLACTHFPLVKPQLAKHLPGINWIDSGEAIARRVKDLLENNRYIRGGKGRQRACILGAEAASQTLGDKLATRGIELIAD